MKTPFSRQSQFELFSGGSGVAPQRVKPSVLNRSVTLSFENIVVLVVAGIMGLIVTFSFGIEMGRRTAMRPASVKTPLDTVSEPATLPAVKTEQPDRDLDNFAVAALPAESRATDVSAVAHAETLQNPEISENPEAFKKKVDKIQALEKIHTIQVASFKQENLADLESETLKKNGYDAFTAQKGSYWIVCVGRFPEFREAQPLLKALKKKYSDCYIRSL